MHPRGGDCGPNWSDDRSFTVGATSFFIEIFAASPSRADRFVIAKSPEILQEYTDLAAEFTGARVVELGIAQGGSVAFFAELLQPSMLVALDIADVPKAALAEFIASRGYAATVHAEYGVDQADRRILEQKLHQHFGNGPLDLVIDDASHRLRPTLESFAVLFPRLRPGGLFVIEDWAHDHTWERVLRNEPERFAAEIAALPAPRPTDASDLSSLILQLMLVVGYTPETVAEVRVRNGYVLVRRGTATLDPQTFDLAACYGDVARTLLATSAGSPDERNLA